MIKSLAASLLAFVFGASTTSCGGDDEAVCTEFLGGLRAAASDCDAAFRADLEGRLQYLSCDGASVRDGALLRAECLPWMESATCAALKSAPDASCVDQVTLRCPEELRGTPRCNLFQE